MAEKSTSILERLLATLEIIGREGAIIVGARVLPTTIIFIDGRFVEREQATVSLFDRGYLYGDGVFETMRGYEGTSFRASAHLDRLVEGGAALGIALPIDRRELDDALALVMRRFGKHPANVRVALSRGVGAGGLGVTGVEHPTLSIVARALAPYPDDAYARGIPSGTAVLRKIPSTCFPTALKTANYLSNVLARREIEAKGFQEGVQLSIEGQVVCGTASNVFLVRGGKLVTPDERSGCRPGVTRSAILEIAERLAVPCELRSVDGRELEDADEIFFTNAIMECLPVASFDGRLLGAPGPVTQRLHDALRTTIAQECGRGLG